MKIEVNLNEVRDIPVLPGGRYPVRVIDLPKVIASKEKKTPGIELQLLFVGPGTEIEPGMPRKTVHTLWHSQMQGWKTRGVKEACEAFGVVYTDTQFDTDDFFNKEAIAVVSQETYTDRKGEPALKNVIDGFLVKAH